MNETSRQYLMRLARRMGFMPLAERLRSGMMAARYWRANRRFQSEHRQLKLPPIFLMHDPYGMVDYAAYWKGGKIAAEALGKIIDEHTDKTAASIRVLEWGCGPARIIRHLPGLTGSRRYEWFGCDYNRQAVQWCRSHLPEITFDANALVPPLIYPTAAFDFIYVISVFTHLSEPLHHAWMAELLRVLKPGGCILLSLHGDYFRRKLLPDELVKYDSGALVVREGVSEGGRMFTAFHGERFVRERLLRSVEILRHEPSSSPVCAPQDLWLVKKSAAA